MSSRLLALLVTAACALLLPQPARASVTAAELDGLVDRNLDALFGRHLAWGGFEDPLTGPQFNYGSVALAWLAGERAAPGRAGDARRAAAALTLRTGTRIQPSGAFQTWLEAQAMTPPNGAWLDAETRAMLTRHLQAYATPIVGARAQACHVKASCYNNLKLVDAVAALQLVRTGLTSPVPGSRLADPASTEQATRAFLATRVPAAQRPDLRITDGGEAAVLSDPSKNPLAYHALSTALLMRAVRLLGPSVPARTRVAARRALWALVGLADPRGTVAWMGRGQENTWTYGASVYAALSGAAEFAEEPALVMRLRRLAELAFAELRAREGATGLAVLPGPPRATLAGADKTQNTVVCNGLTLAFVHLSADEATAAAGPSAPLPAERPGSTVLDPTAAGVAAVRGSHTWLAVHRAATHARDARYDVGLLAAHVLLDGRWRAVVGQRPNTDAGVRAPTAGPLLVRGGRTLRPTGRLAVRAGSISLVGAWRGAGAPVAASWRFAATGRGATLRTPCPRGSRLRLTEWVPAGPGLRHHRRGISLPDRTLRFSAPVHARRVVGGFASAAHERLVGVLLETRCRGRGITVEWRAN